MPTANIARRTPAKEEPSTRLALIDQIPTTGYPCAPRAEQSAPSAAERLQSIGGAVADSGFRADVARGLADVANRTAASVLGGPVDLAAAALGGLGYQHPAPVGGSEWIGQQMERAGAVTPERRPAAELLGSLAGPSAATKAATALGFIAAMSAEGKARLLADLTAGKGSGTYRLGDVTQGQANMLEKVGLNAATTDVRMTDDAFRHLHDKRVVQEGYSPAEVATFAEQAMSKRSRVDLDLGKARQQPSLLNEGMRDPVTGRRYDARMPLDSQGDAFGVRSAVPDGLPPRKK
ncbi:hypothetical protein [Acidovorax sp. 22279]|uniref:hypothetical protein n=1 Tax=Acidovorax sp. 22279 TaxID=3453900 RepID=UPI003F8489CE